MRGASAHGAAIFIATLAVATSVRAQDAAPPAEPPPADVAAPLPPPPDAPAPLPPPARLERPNEPAPVIVVIDPRLVVEPQVVVEPRVRRPRFSVAVGWGASFPSSSLAPSRGDGMPAFFASGDVGADWPVAVELAAFATAVSGASPGAVQGVERLGLDLGGVVQPWRLAFARDDAREEPRLLRALGFELGMGLERDSITVKAGTRWGVHTGLRVELPLGRTTGGTDLRLRFAARRLFGLYTPRVGTIDVDDTFELYSAIVSVF